MKKKFYFILLALIIISTGCSKKEDELVLVTEAGFAPYEYYEDGEIVGVDIEIAKYIAQELNLKLVIKDVAFDSIINEVKSGKADIGAAGISYSEERAKQVDFTINYSTSRQVVIVKDDSKITKLEDLKTTDNLKVAVQLGSVADTYMTENYKNASITRQKKILAAIQDLKTGKVDCVVVDELPAIEILKTNSSIHILEGALFEDNYGMVIKKDNGELLEKVNSILEELKSTGKIEEYILKHTTE